MDESTKGCGASRFPIGSTSESVPSSQSDKVSAAMAFFVTLPIACPCPTAPRPGSAVNDTASEHSR
jgi:hypothetical protein